MKKYFKFATAVVALVMVAAIVVTFEACRKDKISSNIEGKINEGIVYQQNIADRETYIIDFKKKYLSGSKSDEVMTAENANAFLFDLLNFDFCNLNVDYSHVTYEATSYDVSVKDGMIGIGDFAALYSQVSSHVREYYHSLNVINPNYLYMKPEIDYEDGAPTATVTVTAAVSSGFSPKNDAEFDSTLCDHFPPDTLYQWQDAADTLTRYFNIYKPTCTLSSERFFYTNYSTLQFDRLHAPNPALFYCGICDYSHAYITGEEMCEYLNLCLTLAEEYAHAKCIIDGIIKAMIGNDKTPVPIYHRLIVNYAALTGSQIGPNL